MRFKNSSPFIEIVLLKLQHIFHKINYPEEYSTSNPLVFIFIIHFINLKLTYQKGAKIDDVMGNIKTMCFRFKMAIIIT